MCPKRKIDVDYDFFFATLQACADEALRRQRLRSKPIVGYDLTTS